MTREDEGKIPQHESTAAELLDLLAEQDFGSVVDKIFTLVDNHFSGPKREKNLEASEAKALILLAVNTNENLDLIIQILPVNTRKKYLDILDQATEILPEVTAAAMQKSLDWHQLTFIEPDFVTVSQSNRAAEDGAVDLQKTAVSFVDDILDPGSDKTMTAESIQRALNNARLKTPFQVQALATETMARAAESIGIKVAERLDNSVPFDMSQHETLIHFVDILRKLNPPPGPKKSAEIKKFAELLDGEDLVLLIGMFNAFPETKRRNKVLNIFLSLVKDEATVVPLTSPRKQIKPL